ncbi:hypothetical protein ABT167_37435 [Streptomyces sp. NPDC001792]|uniref:hypothetical protein n=1 Tax=Streptomyces sp. NPDC001792 TaxID=3154524 RepID=UPI0033281376
MSNLFIAGVIPGPVAEEFAILETSEQEFTRWAMDFDVPDADTAAARAYVQCRTDDEVEEGTAGALLQSVLADVSISSRRGGDVSAGAVWVWVLAGADAYVRISGTGDTENEIDYAPAEHHGWFAVYDSDAADAPEPVGGGGVIAAAREVDGGIAAIPAAVVLEEGLRGGIHGVRCGVGHGGGHRGSRHSHPATGHQHPGHGQHGTAGEGKLGHQEFSRGPGYEVLVRPAGPLGS